MSMSTLESNLRYFATLFRSATTVMESLPHLNGADFRITALQEHGFLDIQDEDDGTVSFSGYLIDMLDAIAQPNRANFTYTLLPPSGFGSLCVPRLNETTVDKAYDKIYRTQYNCGASDVNDLPVMSDDYSTDMYLGLYYVTPSRQLQNQFTIPFVPPFFGTLAMFGTATGIPTFEALVQQQAEGSQPPACAPAGTALLTFVERSYPGIQIRGFYGGEEDILRAFQDGTCQVFVVDQPIAAQFVLRRSRRGECIANDMPIGVIGEPMDFGLSHYAIGIRRDVPIEVERTFSYWMNVLMSCNPLDPEGQCPEGNLATFFEGRGGTGTECGYVLYPPASSSLGAGVITGIVLAAIFCLIGAFAFWHRYRINRQERIHAKRQKATMVIAQRERELNEYLGHEVRNPLSSAIAALNFVSSKAGDPTYVPLPEKRDSLESDINVVESSLQYVNDLLRDMLDMHRSADKMMRLNMSPTDIRTNILEPVKSIVFMRGAKVDVFVECPQHLVVISDSMRLKQICLNLASNSSKFVEQGFIRLSAEVIDENVHLYIEDSGPGIPKEKQARLFQKFQESLDVLNQGTGIGLSVCKNLSELMGADLYLDTNYDSGIPQCPGTRFTLRLNRPPLDIENGFGTPSDLVEESRNDGSTDLPEGLCILFCDDDTMIRKMFSRTVEAVAPTWKIREASNGETALRFVDEERFDIIFVDHYMASHTKQLLGTETTQALRAKGVDSVICGLSANDKEEEFVRAGADAFMLKPFPCKKEALKHELLKLLDAPNRAQKTN